MNWQSIALITAMSLIPALLWIAVYQYLDKRDPEPWAVITVATLCGVFSTGPVFAMQYLFAHYPQYDVISMLQGQIANPIGFSLAFLTFVAFIEELVKGIGFLTTIENNEKVFNQIVDGIVYGACAGLGFAIAENVYYFYRALNALNMGSDFIAVFIIRSSGTMLAHSLFTGIFGFYFAQAYFSPFVLDESKGKKLRKNFKQSMTHAIRLHGTSLWLLPTTDNKDEPYLYRNALILEGFIMALVLHLIYNALIKIEVFGQHWTFLIVPMLFIMSWYVWSRFFVKMYIKIIHFVRIKSNGMAEYQVE